MHYSQDRFRMHDLGWGLSAAWVAALSLGLASRVAAIEPLFDTWTGFVTGDYSTARFPWATAAGDLDGDGIDDVVVAQWPWASGFACLLNQGDGTFHDPVRYPSAYPSVDITLGDVDGDGDQDVVLSNTGVNWEGSTISVYLNDGNGSFGAQQQHSVDTGSWVGPVGLVLDDFDRDGLLDIATALFGPGGASSEVVVLRGDGLGGFASPVSFFAGQGPYRIDSGDLDADGFSDLVVTCDELLTTCQILFNDGAGGFLPPQPIVDGWGDAHYTTVTLADVDNDDRLDILYSSPWTRFDDISGAIYLYRNQGAGVMGGREMIPMIEWSAGPIDLDVGDINGDGWTDVVGAHFNGRWSDGAMVVLNDGAGGFLPTFLLDMGQQTVAVLATDIDGDSDLDVVAADNFSMAVHVHKNIGGGQFENPPSYPTYASSIHMDVADIDDDGDLDVLTTGGITSPVDAAILRNEGEGSLAPYQLYPVPPKTAWGKLRDLNGDGAVDMLLAGGAPYPFYTLMNNGDGTFGPYTEYPIPSCGGGEIDAFDLDNDGDLDVCYLEYLGCPGGGNDRVFVSLNRGDGTFDPPLETTIDRGPYALAGGDFNGDGIIDLATGNYGTYGAGEVVDVMLGRGDGTFYPHTTYVVEPGPRAILTADLNGDGILDLATHNTGSGASGVETTTVLLGRGDGMFLPAVTYIGSFSHDLLGANSIAAGDPDQDGDLDLMAGNSGSNDICYYTNRGDGTFEIPMRYGVGKSAHSVMYADMTGDGVGDLVGLVGPSPSGATARSVTVVRGTGAGTVGVGDGSPPWDSPRLVLAPGRPNPFSALTWIGFRVPSLGPARLQMFDPVGRLVRTLHDRITGPGDHQVSWDGSDTAGHRMPAGVYIVRLEAGHHVTSGKITLLE